MAFGAELKDFVASFKTGYGLVRSPDEKEADALGLENSRLSNEALRGDIDRANDPINRRIQEAQLAHTQALTANVGEPAPQSALDIANTESLIRHRDAETSVLLQDQHDAAAIAEAARAQFAQQPPQQAIPVPGGEGGGGSELPFAPVAPGASGGAVDAVNAMVTGGDIPQAPGNSPALGDDYFPLAFEATSAGLKAAAGNAGVVKTGVDDGSANAQSSRSYLTGKGAAPMNLVMEVEKIVDPEGKMAPSERRMRALGFVYQQYSAMGKTEAAQNAAGQMLQAYRTASQQYAAFAAAAAEGGDIDTAAKLVMNAYSFVPDGRDVTITKTDKGYAYQLTDASSGKTIEQGIMSPKDMAAMAMNVSPLDFDNYLAQAAGVELEEPEEGASEAFTQGMAMLDNGEQPSASLLAKMSKDEQTRLKDAAGMLSGPSIENRGEITDQVATAMDEFLATAGEGLPEYFTNAQGSIRTAAAGAMAIPGNKGGALDIVETLSDMLAIDPEKPTAQPFKVQETSNSALVKVTVKGHPPVTLRREDYEALGSAWATESKARVTQLGKDSRRAAENAGDIGALGNALGEAGQQAVDTVRGTWEALPKQPPRVPLPEEIIDHLRSGKPSTQVPRGGGFVNR